MTKTNVVALRPQTRLELLRFQIAGDMKAALDDGVSIKSLEDLMLEMFIETRKRGDGASG